MTTFKLFFFFKLSCINETFQNLRVFFKHGKKYKDIFEIKYSVFLPISL